ncbi:hypothetical protein ABUK73_07580 [Agrobacterium sp. BA1120]|uniref:hypothetical protein n=1 Tax=Agrobacterium sp. BA1120 TaxID=3228927 RepID=UPI00336A1CD8
MLPPVSAVSAVDVSFQTAGSRPDNTQTPAAVTPPPQVEQEAATAGVSATVRAVSGELRLSQNVSVLAETLGKLMNIARMDGEAAEAYVNRLVATMQTLPAEQKAGLEKQLGNILRGISLSMLADVLKNSAGPEAARLAVMFELARSSNAAKGAKISVSSYLQDLLPQSAVTLPTPARNPSAMPVVTSGLQLDTTEIILPMDKSEGQTLGKQAAPPAVETDDPALPKPAVTLSPSGIAAPAKPLAQSPVAEQLTRLATALTSLPVTSATLVESSDTDLVELPVNRPITNQSQPVEARAPEVKSGLPEATVPSRMLPTAPHQVEGNDTNPTIGNQLTGATVKDMEALLFTALLGKLPERAEAAALPALLPPQPDVDVEHAMKPHLATVPVAPHVKPAETAQDEATLSAARPEMAAAQRVAAAAGDAENAILNQPSLHSAVAALITKEGIPLPFVNYPAAKDEPDSDAPPRGRWPSSDGGSEGQEDSGEQTEQGSDQEERTAANDEIIDHSVSEGANDDGAAGNAESYYLRMSGFS